MARTRHPTNVRPRRHALALAEHGAKRTRPIRYRHNTESYMKTRRWQDWVNLLLGVWLFLSPWLLGYTGASMTASWNAWILGVALVVFSAIAVSVPRTWEEII